MVRHTPQMRGIGASIFQAMRLKTGHSDWKRCMMGSTVGARARTTTMLSLGEVMAQGVSVDHALSASLHACRQRSRCEAVRALPCAHHIVPMVL